MIVLPVAKFTRSGMLQGVVMQSGKTAADAFKSQELASISNESIVFAGMERSGHQYHAPNEDGCMIVPVSPRTSEVTIFTIALKSLNPERILASDTATLNNAPWELLSSQLSEGIVATTQ